MSEEKNKYLCSGSGEEPNPDASEAVIVGGGLAGAEAAWQLARRGVSVRLFEMRPSRKTPAHRTGSLAELVCSNSFKALDPGKAHGLLKEEMLLFGSLILACARRTRVPAGGALAVDRGLFAEAVTGVVEADPLITVLREEVTEIPAGGVVVIAAGPLVSESLAESISAFTGREHLYFFDAIAPVVESDSIDRKIVFSASRYVRGGEGDYLNCPMTAEEYELFVDALLAGEKARLHPIDQTPFFEGCLPVEEMARRGRETLRFGPMRPVGLRDPRTGRRPHAVVQLRQDDLAAEHYSLVGFQTQLKWSDQKRIFRMIPGLASAGFARYGQLHRNCYINAPSVLEPTLAARRRRNLFFAGQICGVEGYIESAAMGLLAGINAARYVRGLDTLAPPRETMIGSLCHYLATADPGDYQPRNVTFGLLPAAPGEPRGKVARRQFRAAKALRSMENWIVSCGEKLSSVCPGVEKFPEISPRRGPSSPGQ